MITQGVRGGHSWLPTPILGKGGIEPHRFAPNAFVCNCGKKKRRGWEAAPEIPPTEDRCQLEGDFNYQCQRCGALVKKSALVNGYVPLRCERRK